MAFQARHLRRWVISAPAGTARFWLCLTVLLSRISANRRARLKVILVGLFMPAHDVLPLVKKARPFGVASATEESRSAAGCNAAPTSTR